MFSIKYIKLEPTEYVFQYKNGKIKRQGRGLSFFYYAPTTSMALVPTESMDAPFIYSENTSDFQQVNIQGQINFRIKDPEKIINYLNYNIKNHKKYASEDPKKLPQRVINIAKVIIKKKIEELSLKESLKSTEALTKKIMEEINENQELKLLGIEILGLSILAITPVQETSRALEAEAREKILQEADDALYGRRNASVEQERKIRENELNTEIAMENKKKQIKEAELEGEKLIQDRRNSLKDEKMDFEIKLEEKRKKLISLVVENEKAKAESRAYSISAIMKAFENANPETIQALATSGMKPEQLIALSFQALGKNADKIGQLNISPDLMQELIKKQ